MKSAPATSRRASRVSKAATPRHLITDAELCELVRTLETTVECNLFGGTGANTPHRALKAWKAERATWVEKTMSRDPGPAEDRKHAERVFKETDECANMLRRVLGVFAAA
jgi:hypothetical protein